MWLRVAPEIIETAGPSWLRFYTEASSVCLLCLTPPHLQQWLHVAREDVVVLGCALPSQKLRASPLELVKGLPCSCSHWPA